MGLKGVFGLREALYYELEGDKIRCLLCPKACLLGEGQVGVCGVRVVEGGRLYAENYGLLAAANWDPIEKKPLYHFFPGRQILSLGTVGCNLHCSFCQNWSLARGKPDQCADAVSPRGVLAMLEHGGGDNKALGVAYTYNEPFVWYEFVLETAQLLHGLGYKNVLVTNGFVNPEPLIDLLPYIDAMNIDLKAFNDSFYPKRCRGEREPVMRTIETAVRHCHVEITCLLIPSLNDDLAEQEEMARWLASLDPDLVLHYSRYFPNYRLDLPPTPPELMEKVVETAKKHLNYVYPGNINLPGASDTYCPGCRNLLVSRSGYQAKIVGLEGANCNRCGRTSNIIGPV
jgi:pyruvate formate lyase activating enzyme